MSRFPKFAATATLALALSTTSASAEGDAAEGETLFKRCAACHAVGEGAKHKVGPHLNDIVGRIVGTAEGYNYSKAMTAAGKAGMTWTAETLDTFLAKPKEFIKGTKMSFAGLGKESERAHIIAYLRNFSKGAESTSASADAPESAPPAEPSEPVQQTAAVTAPAAANDAPLPTHGILHLGRPATPEEIAAWDIDVRPDGTGLPEGKGTVAEGEAIYAERCAACHGDFGEGRDRWPVLAGGFDTLNAERPVKTIGSYWPYLSTVYDYVRRAMPFGDAHSLSDDDVYALTAYLLYLNDVVADEDFELSKGNFTSIRLPNEDNFFLDDRTQEAHYVHKGEPCMNDCEPGPAKITMRAQVLDVTPDSEQSQREDGSVD